MTTTIALRADAEAEAARIQASKSTPRRTILGTSAEVITTAIHRRSAASLPQSGIIFFTRTRIVDGSGRAVEDIMIPLHVSASLPVPRTRRRELRGHAQELFDKWLPAVRRMSHEETASRVSILSSEYGRGLLRARAREKALRRLAASERARLIQPGLFDGRAVAAHASVLEDDREEALENAAGLLLAYGCEPVLLLLVGGAG